MSVILVFDADNTLWDTNAIFREAQVGLLRVFAKAGLMKDPEAELGNLREMDLALIRRSGQFEYDFRCLANAVGIYYSGKRNVEEAADQALQQVQSVSSSIIDESCKAFEAALNEIPSLFGDAEQILKVLRGSRTLGQPIVVMLFSDGKPDRIERILRAHHLEGSVFDEIVMRTKTVESFNSVRALGMAHLTTVDVSSVLSFMIGDSLKRDIGPAKKAGFTTVYKPAEFLGTEVPADRHQEPDFRIDSLAELIPLLEGMGVSLKRTRKTASKRRAAVTAVR
jgi:putative hydrolase of the HAD superfamily